MSAKKQTFEQEIARLEEIVAALEKGDAHRPAGGDRGGSGEGGRPAGGLPGPL